LGELLWDLLPGGKQLGGAPANFAYISSLLGERALIASRVGDDALGREALDWLAQRGLETSFIQIDASHPTSTALVELDSQQQPSFAIWEDVAWDYLGWTSHWHELASEADAVCFGTLAQRSPHSRATIMQFLRATPESALVVFDINLRQSFYSAEVIDRSLVHASVVKLSADELLLIADLLEIGSHDEETCAKWLLSEYDLELVCLTRGAAGSLLISRSETSAHPGCQVHVVDTVGAGDAFTAGLVHSYLAGASLAQMNEAANRLGGWVASEQGAMPVADRESFNKILR
jgi:fructokinase